MREDFLVSRRGDRGDIQNVIENMISRYRLGRICVGVGSEVLHSALRGDV